MITILSSRIEGDVISHLRIEAFNDMKVAALLACPTYCLLVLLFGDVYDSLKLRSTLPADTSLCLVAPQ